MTSWVEKAYATGWWVYLNCEVTPRWFPRLNDAHNFLMRAATPTKQRRDIDTISIIHGSR